MSEECIVTVRVPGLSEVEWKLFVFLLRSEGRDVKEVVGAMIRDFVKQYLREHQVEIKEVEEEN